MSELIKQQNNMIKRLCTPEFTKRACEQENLWKHYNLGDAEMKISQTRINVLRQG